MNRVIKHRFGGAFLLQFYLWIREIKRWGFKAWRLRVQKMYVEGFKVKLEKGYSELATQEDFDNF